MVSRKYVVPPETALRITGTLESPISTEYTFHPNRKKTRVFLPNTAHSYTGDTLELVVINVSARYVTLKKDQVLASATEIDSVLDDEVDDEDSFSDQLPDLRSYGPDDDSSDSNNEEEMEDLHKFVH